MFQEEDTTSAKALNIVKIGHNRQYPESYREVPQDVRAGTPGMCSERVHEQRNDSPRSIS